ncbi:NAD(P)H-quinone oxidoreductase subunit 2, chloroplastic [anaerobic digester metagenome]
MVELLLLVPLVTALLCGLSRSERAIYIFSVAGSLVAALVAIPYCYQAFFEGPVDKGLWYLDPLSGLFMVVIVTITALVSLYSVQYLEHDRKEGEVNLKDLRYYHVLLHLFAFSMLMVVVVDSLGLMWIAVEGTTLVSAFLVGFYKKSEAMEASWKYLIICSVGITLALLGIILLYASSVSALGENADTLDWSVLRSVAGQLDPALVKVSFIFILVGLGTKAGLAPMHTWLPDAHSQAPTPISALLSAVLLNCAMYGVLRVHILASEAVPGFSSSLLLFFGLLSLAIATAFILTSRDLKRFLAFSSVEHMGIIALGFGIGGPLAVFGAVFHVLAHSLTKTLMFFGAGNVIQKYRTREMKEIKGLGKTMPATAALLVLGGAAIAGSPPFAIFIGELFVISGALAQGDYLVAGLFIALIVMIFAGMTYRVFGMVSGRPQEGLPDGEIGKLRLLPMLVLATAILLLGLFLPEVMSDALGAVVELFGVSA